MLNLDRLEVQLRERCGLPWRDAHPSHGAAAVLPNSPFVVGGGCGDGTATLVLVGVQHEGALGGVEYVISGMGGSVVKNAGVLYTGGTITYMNEISGCGGFYPGESFAARYDIIAEPGTLRYFERFEVRASVESIQAYRCHIIQSERLQ